MTVNKCILDRANAMHRANQIQTLHQVHRQEMKMPFVWQSNAARREKFAKYK